MNFVLCRYFAYIINNGDICESFEKFISPFVKKEVAKLLDECETWINISNHNVDVKMIKRIELVMDPFFRFFYEFNRTYIDQLAVHYHACRSRYLSLCKDDNYQAKRKKALKNGTILCDDGNF